MMTSNKKMNGKVEILIVEDSPTQAAQLAHLLEQHGYGVTTASNGREALALLDRSMPTLIISDVVMPELDGYGLCKAIKANEKWKHIPVMLVTMLSDAQDVIRGLECGADNFIRKPYDEKTLLSRIDYLLMNLELRKNQKMQMGAEINLGGQRHFITSERQQMLDLLISTYEEAVDISNEFKLQGKELAHSNQVLRGLYRIAEGLNQAGSEQEVVELALERALELPEIQAGWIFLREGESGFRLAAARSLPSALEAPGAMEGDCACRSRLISGALDSVTNILECERLQKATGDTRGLRYHASVPLWIDNRALGVMNLVGPGKGLFTEDELKVLHSVGNQLAVALERARLREHLETLVEERTARIIRLSRIYAVISGINTTIVRVRDRQRLFEEACRIAVEQGKFTFAWIGTLDAGTQEITPVAKAGRDDGYLSQINLTAREDAPGNCELTSRALARGVPVVCNDIASDERMKTWRAEALGRGYRSVGLFPFFLDGRSTGVFVLYAPEPGVFDEEEMRLLVEMADDISFALDHMKKEELLEQRTDALTAEIAERKRIEQEQARLVAIIEATPDFVATSDPKGHVRYCNQAGLRMLGYEPGHDGSALRIREAHPEWAAKLVLETGIPHAIEHGSWTGEAAFLRTDGREVPISQVILAHRGAGGSVESLSTIARDMTARNEAEEALRRSEERYRQIVEGAQEGIWMIDADNRVTFANPRMCDMLNYTSEEIVGRSLFDFLDPVATSEVESRIARRRSGLGDEYDVQFRRRDGVPVWTRVTASPLRDASGNYAGGLSMITDISARKAAEKHLAQMEGRYRGLLEAAPDAMVVVNEGGEIVLLNVQTEKQFGYHRDELVGQKVKNIIPEGFAERLIADGTRSAADALAQQIGMGIELTARRKDGSEFPIEIMLSPLESAEGILVTAAIRDVTERLRSQEEHRRMEHRLEQAQRVDSLGRVAATIAHEFNNVLMGIQPFAEVISRRAGDDERISKAAEQILNSVRRGKRVTDDILRFTRPIEPQLEVIDMGKWVAQIEPELRSVAGSSVQITASVPGKLLFARCDAAQMQQVATNLVINARDAMPNGGTITLTLATSTREDNLLIGLGEGERFVHLSVRDNGSGIAPEMLEQIFEPLFTTKRSGTGLGLAVARRVMTQHGGFIFAENEPGGGTAFHILLPRVDEALSTAVAVAAQKINGRIRRLLLVEDEVSVAAGLSSLLELEEIVVRVVGLGREVVPAIEEFAPDAVVLDLTLPDVDGREVFAQIGARWPDLPVVFSTGHGGKADLASELSRGHVGFLQKPYDFDALLAAIEAVV